MPSSVSIINPLDEKSNYETLAEEENQTDGTYFYYVDMSKHKKVGFQLQDISPGSGHISITCEGTLQNGVEREDCSYQDITSDTFTVASGVSDDLWIDDAEKLACFKYVRLKVECSSGDDTCDYKLYRKKLY